MMRKLLVFMIVLGLASIANATLQISVSGNNDPAQSEYTLTEPSAVLNLGIWTDDTIQAGYGEGYWALTAQTSQVAISGGVNLFAEDPGIFISDDAAGAGVQLPSGENGVYGAVVLALLSNIATGSTIYNEINLHCEGGMGDVILTLWANAEATPESIDTVIIHQIPEPMTMTLLGLGGLGLIRRKK
jgi:hypothetical protein